MRKRAQDNGLDRTGAMRVIVIMSMAVVMPMVASARSGSAMGATTEYAILVGVLAVIVIVAMPMMAIVPMVMGVRFLLAAAVVALAQTVNVLGALPRFREAVDDIGRPRPVLTRKGLRTQNRTANRRMDAGATAQRAQGGIHYNARDQRNRSLGGKQRRHRRRVHPLDQQHGQHLV